MGDIGRTLVIVGGFILGLGLLMIFMGKTHLPIGHLPGDMIVKGKNSVFYFPFTTSILLSVLLSLLLYVVGRLRR